MHERRVRAPGVFAVGSVLVLLVVVACTPPASTGAAAESSTGGQAAGDQATRLPIKFGWQIQTDWLFFAARASGIFEEVGLAPEYVQFPSGREMMAGMQSQSIDVAVTSAGVVFDIALAQGLDVKVLYVYLDHAGAEGLVAAPNSGIRQVADLVGKRVGYTKGSGAHYALSKALLANNLTPDRLTLLDLAPDKAFPALLNGDIDAWWAWQPWRAKAEAEGARLIATDKDFGVSTVAVWYARSEWIARNPETAKRLARAAVLTAERLQQDRSPGIKAMAQVLSISEDMAAQIYELDYIPAPQELLDERYYLSMTSPSGLAHVLTDIAAFLHEQKIISRLPEPGKAIDPEPLRAVLQANR